MNIFPLDRYTNLGRMCSEVGWKHRDTIKTLEEKRKVKSEAFWAKKKEMIQVRTEMSLTTLCCLAQPWQGCIRNLLAHASHPKGNTRVPYDRMRTLS